MFKFTMATEKKKAAKKAVKKKVAKKTETASAKSKLEELKAKAKALEGKVDEEKKIDIKGEVFGEVSFMDSEEYEDEEGKSVKRPPEVSIHVFIPTKFFDIFETK